jgi:hypothetical protein
MSRHASWRCNLRAMDPCSITLAGVLIDCFERNEVFAGFHEHQVPLPDEGAAVRLFHALVSEARAWKGEPSRTVEREERRLVAWPELEIRQAGRGIMVRVRSPAVDSWWHDPATWAGDPLGLIRRWVSEDER